MSIAALNLVGARALAKKTAANIAKRKARLEKQGVYTQAAKKFDELRKGPTPKTRNEWVSYASKLAELDRSKGLRAETAPKVWQVEKARMDRKSKLHRVEDVAQRRKMKTPELREAASALRKNLVASRNRVLKATGRPNHATKKLDELIAEFDSKRKLQPGGLTHQQLSSYVSKMAQVRDFEGISVKGARKQEQRGVEIFGDSYNTFDDDERAAVWDEVHRRMETSFGALGSGEALKQVRAELDAEDVQVQFSTTPPDANGRVRKVATFGGTGTDAAHRAAKREHRADTIADIINRSRNVLGDDDDDDDNPPLRLF